MVTLFALATLLQKFPEFQSIASLDSLIAIVEPQPPCSEPIHYSLGSFDRRFDISPEQFLTYVSSSAQLWDQAAGKPLFIEDEPNGSLKIGLVYDDRQLLTQKLAKMHAKMLLDQEAYAKLKRTYDARAAALDAMGKKLRSIVDAVNVKARALSAEVKKWNAKGGAPRNVQLTLQARQKAITAEQKKIAPEQKKYNTEAAAVNALARELNTKAKALNREGTEYVNTNAPLAAGIEAGLYTADASGTRIEVFQYDDLDHLQRTLTHELGHALDLGHVTDTEAVMHFRNSGGSIHPQDLAELQRVCRFP